MTRKTAVTIFAALAIYGAGLNANDPAPTPEDTDASYPTLTAIGAEIAASEETYTAKLEREREEVRATEDAADLKEKRTRKAKDDEAPPPVVDINKITEDTRIELLDAGYAGDPNDGSDNILYAPDVKPEPYTYHDKPVYEEVICDPSLYWLGMTFYESDHIVIRYNDCKTLSMGGDSADLDNTRAHERAHAEGWKHGEGTPETNAAYHATQHLGDGR